jgi:hypothetical protein
VPPDRDLAARYHFDDFTEQGYRAILQSAKRGYSFEPFGADSGEPHVLWRHDVDISVHRAVRLAEIEADEGVRATYFFLLRSQYYNLLEDEILRRAREVLEMGHWLGLHFDPSSSDPHSPEELERGLTLERDFLSDLLERPIEAFSFHNPTIHDFDFRMDEIAGMLNTYGRGLDERYSYVSDSNGIWRHRRLPEVVEAAEEPRLHVLTHPELWQAEAMSPRDRVGRAIDGRAANSHRAWDDLLERWGRENVG